MRALILAAGLGSRLKQKTKNIPKALVQVNNKPIISFQIEALRNNKIKKIGIVLGYKSDVLKNYLIKNHKDIEFTFFTNDEYKCSNSAYSFYLAKDFIKNKSYIHLNCDVIFSKELLAKLIKSRHTNVIALSKKLNLTNNMEQVKLDKKNKIIKMDNMQFDEAIFKAYGLAKLSNESSNYIIDKIEKYLNQKNKNMNYYGIIRQAVQDIDYYGVDCKDQFLLEVNTLNDLDIANKIL